MNKELVTAVGVSGIRKRGVYVKDTEGQIQLIDWATGEVFVSFGRA